MVTRAPAGNKRASLIFDGIGQRRNAEMSRSRYIARKEILIAAHPWRAAKSADSGTNSKSKLDSRSASTIPFGSTVRKDTSPSKAPVLDSQSIYQNARNEVTGVTVYAIPKSCYPKVGLALSVKACMMPRQRELLVKAAPNFER